MLLSAGVIAVKKTDKQNPSHQGVYPIRNMLMTPKSTSRPSLPLELQTPTGNCPLHISTGRLTDTSHLRLQKKGIPTFPPKTVLSPVGLISVNSTSNTQFLKHPVSQAKNLGIILHLQFTHLPHPILQQF